MPRPLLLRIADIKPLLNTTAAAADARLKIFIEEAGALLEKQCDRRFDEYMTTRYYSARQVDEDGDLIDNALALDADLKQHTQVVTGGSIQVSPRPIPRNSTPIFFLEATGNQTWLVNSDMSRDDIAVTGLWGYGGEWLDASSLSAGINNSATVIPVTDGALYEAGSLIKIDSEYCYISSVSGNSLNVVRAFNGSAAAAHLSGAGAVIFIADAVVRHTVLRLVQWHMKQVESPLTNQTVLGDVSMITTVDAVPNDVRALIKRLTRRPRMG